MVNKSIRTRSNNNIKFNLREDDLSINDYVCIRITLKSGYIEFPYMYIEYPPWFMRNIRNWERWRRKVISIANQNGGWKIVDYRNTYQNNYIRKL